jgi:hypothetical protein
MGVNIIAVVVEEFATVLLPIRPGTVSDVIDVRGRARSASLSAYVSMLGD